MFTIESIDDFMTAHEAAEYLNYSADYIGKLCRDGSLPGARRMGCKIWIVPKKSVEEYKPGPRGRYAEKLRKRAELNDILRGVYKFGQEKERTSAEYVTVEEAAEMLNRSRRCVREWCKWGQFEGARKEGDCWLIPVDALNDARSPYAVRDIVKQAAERH